MGKKIDVRRKRHFAEEERKRYLEEERKRYLEQERLLRQSANRAKFLPSNTIADKTFFSCPANVETLPKNHWRWSDPYSRLGLPKNASEKMIKTQYRKFALIYHPDKSRLDDTLAPFQAVKEAYELLCKWK